MESMRIPAILLFACLGLEAASPGSSSRPVSKPQEAGMGEVDLGIPIRNWDAPRYFRVPAPQDSASPVAPDVFVFEPTPLIFVAVPPCRILDTRGTNPPTPAYGSPYLSHLVLREFQLGGSCLVPPGAVAVSANATVTATSGPGYLSLWAGGVAFPNTSTMNWTAAGSTLANSAIVPLGSTGTIQARAYIPPAGTTEFILDVNGYYTSDPMSGPYLRYYVGTDQTITTGTPLVVNYDTLAEASADARGLVTTGANWHFTAPKDGVYLVRASAAYLPATWATGGHTILIIGVNGLYRTYLGGPSYSSGYSGYILLDGVADVVLAAGDQLAIQAYQISGASKTILGSSSSASISIRFVRPYP